MSGPDVPAWLAIIGTPAFAALGLIELARYGRDARAWWDMIAVGFAVWFGLLAVIGWAVLAAGAIA